MIAEFFYVIGLMTVCNEKGVFGLDNDEVVNSKKGYPRLFTTVEDNVVFGFDFIFVFVFVTTF